jgi:hypothetical protein
MALRSRTALLTLLLTLLLAACGSTPAAVTPTPPASALTKGEFMVDTGQLGFLGLSTNGQQVIAYLCDGTEQQLSLAEWFTGPVTTSGGIDLTSPAGAHLVASMGGQEIMGTVTLKDGRSAPFTAGMLMTPDSDMGLFRSEASFAGVPYVGGWILGKYPAASAAPGSVAQLFGGNGLSGAQAGRGVGGSMNRLSGGWMIGPEPEGGRGGIINKQTGALTVSPRPDSSGSVSVPNVGTFKLTPCRQGQCG